VEIKRIFNHAATRSRVARLFYTILAPIVALILISTISIVTYIGQTNAAESQERETIERTDAEALGALGQTFDKITKLGNQAAQLENQDGEEFSDALATFLNDEKMGTNYEGITFIAHIKPIDSVPTFSTVVPSSSFHTAGKSLEGFPVSAFIDLEKELDTSAKTATAQISRPFVTQQLLQDQVTYTMIVFPVYSTKSIPASEQNRVSVTTGYITIAIAMDYFLESAQESTDSFRVFRLTDTEGNLVATNNSTIDPDEFEIRSQPIEIANQTFKLEYDSPETSTSGSATSREATLYTGLGLAIIVFLIFTMMRLSEKRARRLAENAEREIHESEARFSALIEQSTDITFVLNPDGTISFASPSVWTQLGYTHEDIVGRNVLSLVSSRDMRRRALGMLHRLNRGEKVEPFEVEVLTKGKRTKLFECVINDLRDDDAVNGIVCNSRDITERKQAEVNEMKAKALYEDALSNAPTGVALVYKDGTCFFCNEALQTFLGRDFDEVTDLRLRDFIYADDQFAFSEMWQSLETRGAERTNTELRFEHPDGRHRWGFISVQAVYDDDKFQYHIIQVEDTTERRSIAERLEYQAIHDPLTGLPNRLLFVDRLDVALQRAKRTGFGVTVLFLDLDRFKVVNDSLGHAAGDRLLVAVADRIKSSVRPNDTIARFGGDEFVVLCEDISDERQTDEISSRLLENINRPIMLEEGEVYVTASIGIARSLAGEETPETILRDADTAMYRAKDGGRNRSEVFDERTHARAVANLETGNGMFRALSEDEFRVRYQPVISLSSGRLSGFEALVYWEHPERGHIGPNEFISLAEETGVIVPLGMRIFETACNTLADWHKKSKQASHLTMSINLSPRQLAEPTLISEVKKIIERTQVNPARLWFEITETALMVDTDSTIAMLEQLRNLGVHFEVDDFGTGFSSLSYLKKFPLDAVKIDQGFVDGLGRDPEDTAIVTAVVSLSHALGLHVIAEGVETPLQMAELKTLGCEYAQGYLFARANSKEHWDTMVGSEELFTFSEESL
jgi:diguanylate cyclase (GGDEF)-like protein/PAS domain S-box-containing protein